jgi:peptide/nickel transport system substrate-binding protein
MTNNFSRTQAAALGVVLLSLLAAVGCSTAPPQASRPAADGPVQPKVNRLVVAIPPLGFELNNPSRGLTGASAVQARPMYETLLTINPATDKSEPQLASEWRLEPDGRSYRFKLRQGIPFHDKWGEMTAKDVAFTIADLSSIESTDGNSADFREGIESVETINDHEVVLHFKRPDGKLASNIFTGVVGLSIHSKAQIEATGNPSLLQRAVPGTGPYQYQERAQAAFIRFERVPYQHWRVQPDFPELELRFVSEASTRQAALLSGEVQMTTLPNDLMPGAERQGMRIAKGTQPGLRTWLRIRCCFLKDLKDPSKGYKYPDSPLLDPRVRRALSKAINRDELAKSLFGGKAETMILNHFHPSDRLSWNPDWEKRFPEAYGYDPAKARQLLQEAGYGPSKPLSTNMVLLSLPEVPNSQDVQDAIASYWRNVGVQVQLLTVDRAADVRKTAAQEYDNHLTIIAAPAPHFQGMFVFNTYSGGNGAPLGGVVMLPEVDALYQKVRVEPDETRQGQLWRQLGDLTFNGFQDVPLFWLPTEMVYNPSIVQSYLFPGTFQGVYTHLEYLKAAR